MLSRGKPRPISFITTVIFGAALAALLLIALFPVFPRQFNIRVGDTAARTIKSPRSVSFESTFLTQQRRDDAAKAVPPSLVFDPSVRTDALAQYDRTTAQVTDIRSQATDVQRKRDQLGALGLSPRSTDTVLALADDRWQAVIAEGRRVLIQQLSVSLDATSVTAARNSIDSLIAPDFVADEALLTAELVRPQVVTTLVEDKTKTEQAQAAARAAVPPERVNI